MDTIEALEDLARLLSRVPGVKIAWTQALPEMLRVGVKIEEPRSLGLLVHLSGDWNIPFSVETQWECAALHDDVECVRYDLRIPREEVSRVSKLKRVATVLLDELESRGVVGREEAAAERAIWRER